MTQPALSMQIRESGADLGAALVERRPGEVLLTEVGARCRAAPKTCWRRPRSRRFRPPSRKPAERDACGSASSRRWRLTCCRASCPRCSAVSRIASSKCGKRRPAACRGARAAARSTPPCWRCRSASADIETLDCSRTCSCWRFRRAIRARRTLRSARRYRSARLILLEEGHCLRDQALAFCADPARATQARRACSAHQPCDRDADGREWLRRDAGAAESPPMSKRATGA